VTVPKADTHTEQSKVYVQHILTKDQCDTEPSAVEGWPAYGSEAKEGDVDGHSEQSFLPKSSFPCHAVPCRKALTSPSTLTTPT
jgi:ABC-type uncharacterized transport system YnjBCD substrate-binding protein